MLGAPKPRTLVGLALSGLVLALSACGEDEQKKGSGAAKPTAKQGAGLTAVKGYLTEHSARLARDVGNINKDAESYYKLAEAEGFDYDKLLKSKRKQVAAFVKKAQDDFRAANPAYEEMEGVVAGVPSLADYDVIIDAGGDASDPETAVPFSIRTPKGRTFKQPGNFNFLVETTVFGTEPKFQAKGVKADLDGDGKVEFGESVPDADFYVATTREFKRYADELDDAANKYRPNNQDALTALVVMTPTMSEYFEAWKNSRFIAGDKASEKAFVAASRLQDIADILGGLVLIYDNVEPVVSEADRQQAKQTGASLKALEEFAAKLRDKEAGGRKYTAEEADTLGSQAQERAESIAGQVSQAAAKLNIKLEDQ